MNARNILTVLAILLALLLFYTAWWGYNLKNDKTKLLTKNDKLSTELADMDKLKNDLKAEVDSLAAAYETLNAKNGQLQGSLDESESIVEKRNSKIRKLQREIKNGNSAKDGEISSLRSQIQGLLSAKSGLESSILSLKAENDSLRMKAGMLEGDLANANKENEALANLNKSIQDEVKRLTLANFKASAFRVEVEKKKPKVTSKSRSAKKIKVSFDLTNVPTKYHGVRPIYMTIADDKANPIMIANPINVKVVVNGQSMDISAVETKEINVIESQRLSFSHTLENKLKKGYYRVAVYTDIGLLGATSIRLR